MFDKRFFIDNQRFLLFFANTQYGKSILGHGLDHIDLILPNAVFQKLDKNTYKAEFRTHDKYSKRLFCEYKPIWKAFHWFDMVVANVFIPRLNLGFDSLEVNPNADPESTSVDGRAFRDAVDEAWATIHDSTGTGAQDSGGQIQHIYLRSSTTSNQWGNLYRSFYLFDTSPLSAGASISAATLSVWVASVTSQFGGAMGIVTTNPASNTALAAGDYTTFGSVRQASDITITSLTTSSYNDWALNATGLGNISKTSITKFGSRTSFDIDNSPPAWASAQDSGVTADYAEGTNDPKLVVTYTVGTPFDLTSKYW